MDSPARSPLVYAFAGAIGMAVAMGIGRFVYTPILPRMMEELGLSASDAGLIASANYAGYLAGAVLAAGNWAQGREYAVAMASLLASALLAVAMAFGGGLTTFLILRFLAGLASAFAMLFLSTLVLARLALAHREDLNAWHFGGVGLGIAVSALTTGLLYAAGASWDAGWTWAGALSAGGLVAVLFLVDRGPARAQRPVAEPALAASPAMVRIILAYGLFGFGYIVTATFIIAIVRQDGAGVEFEAVVWLATGLAALPSVWLWNVAVRRIGLAAVFALCNVVEAVGVAASVGLDGRMGPLVGGVLLGGTFIAITALGLQLGRRLAGDAPRRVMAMMTAAFGVGQIVGPIVAGVVADRTGSFTAPSLIAAAALLLAAVIAWGIEPANPATPSHA